MKIKITLKDPDGVYESLREAATNSITALELEKGEREDLIESRHERYGEECKQWIEYGEYVTIEIDTDAGTATVCKVK